MSGEERKSRRGKRKEKDTRSPEEIIGEVSRLILEKLNGPDAMAQELCRLMENGTPRQRIQAIEVGYSLSLCAEVMQKQRQEREQEQERAEGTGSTGEDQENETDAGDAGAQKNAPSPETRKRRRSLPKKIVRF